MSDKTLCTIFILTDTPGTYGDDLVYQGNPPTFVRDIDVLIEKLKNVTVAGLVLELAKVMKASRTQRDRLFSFAGNFPVLRTKINPRHGFVAYLDPKDCFFSNLDKVVGERCRNHERISVNLDCAFSREADPSMADPMEGTILDISPGGCFIHTQAPLEGEAFLHVRMPHLSNPRPIYSSVRWTKQDASSPMRCGMGVMFIDLTEDQMAELTNFKLSESPAP